MAALPAQAAGPATPLRLEIADDGKQLKLLVRHPAIGLVCELWCYEGGPFQYGKGTRREDGSVVLVHTARQMTATTTFTPRGQDRIAMEVRVEGPLAELKTVRYVGPCVQFWHSEAFQRREKLTEFAGRCFVYTVRGPVGMLETARGRMQSFPADAPENNPPCTQWYVPIDAPHPGDIWGFGASGDRPLYGIVGVSSRDGKWLAAIGCARTQTLGQGWHDCIHHVPSMQAYLDERAGRILHQTVLYVMPNNRRRLLASFQRDSPAEEPSLKVAAGKSGTLQARPRSQAAPSLNLALDLLSGGPSQKPGKTPAWSASPWGGFVRGGAAGRLWAYPNGEALELWGSLPEGADKARVEASLDGAGWTAASAPEGIPALVRRSADGAWIAALLWEHPEGNPALSAPSAASESTGGRLVRGRLYLFQGDMAALRERWARTTEEWRHARPYRMPVARP
jgi:hypothetical protein